jgi:hypothetical protein
MGIADARQAMCKDKIKMTNFVKGPPDYCKWATIDSMG